MKRILFALVALAVLAACNEKNDNVCTISGTLTDSVDTVRLVDMSGKVLDVAAVTDGTFALKCEIDHETGVSILRGPVPSGDVCYVEEARGYAPVALIPDVREISVTITDSVPVVSGSPLSQEIQEYQQWSMDTFFGNVENYTALMETGDSIAAENVYAEGMRLIADRSREVYQAHKADAIGAQALGLLIDLVDEDEFITLFEQGGKAVKADTQLSDYYEQLKSAAEEAEGKVVLQQ